MPAKNATANAALALILMLAQFPALADGFLKRDGRHIVDESGDRIILRGMGLGGFMLQEGYMLELPEFGTQQIIRSEIEKLIGPEKTREFHAAWLDNHTTKADIDAMKAWGFNSVRLPMHFGLYTLPVDQEPVAGEHTWLEDGFRRTDALLAWAKANDMYLILDLHAAPGGQGNDINISDRDPKKPSFWDDPANQDKAIALWVKLAQRYKDEPNIGGYDLINEPNWGFADKADKNGCAEKANSPLREFLKRATHAIRAVDKRHIVIIEGNCWGNNYAGVFDQGVWDDNLVISFHRYWNYTTPETMVDMLALRDKYDLPLWLGETGENSNDWFARTVALVEAEGIGWAWWPLKKIRYNNPLQIVPNEGYRKLLDYWSGKGKRPSREQAEAALMRLASHDVRFQNNVQHPDVVDALFRAAHTDQTVPFKPHRIGADGGQIRAADFDMGRNRHAYYSLKPANYHVSAGGERVTWNTGLRYRNDGIDIGTDPDGGAFVAGMQAGEWLKYTFSVERAGRYTLLTDAGNDGLSVRINGAAVDPAGFDLHAGTNTLVVKAAKEGVDLRSLRFAPLGPSR
ncbi:cellulase (glycosyl hydrolase family 5) [Luteimonas cucumeris]|uniref:Cellulase (Glycosyl hydrolase family 5) n=1 Tax=Luteimonas cucumeris TaxID=985012 RepID=A0A562L892_9GAMM|nr:cellulase family glycosylhydrolase [Luteimonas cucumeris]TWI03892.1 cellulase (glycosyl hydrolase family 5) [Luteimonas cucumeris]